MKAAIYTRQSIEKRDSLSIDAQAEKCIQYCNYKGLEYEVYKDAGYSGKDIHRPDFERLLADLKAGKIKTIITYRLDRISRSITDFGNLITLFEKYGVDFISVSENFDTSTPMGRAMVMIVMVFAQLERETIAERIKDNCYYRAKLGRWTGGPVPFGYSSTKITESGKEKSILTVDTDESIIINKIFDMYLSSKSVRKVVADLNGSGIKTKKGSNWTQKTLSQILRNALYTTNTTDVYNYFVDTGINIVNEISDFDGQLGCMFYGRTSSSGDSKDKYHIIVGEHKGIIPGEKWIEAQEIMSKNKSSPPRTGKGTSILSGIVKCGICGYMMLVTQSLMYSRKRADRYPAENITYRYYKCGAKQHQGNHVCDNTAIRVDEIEKRVLKDLKQKIKKFVNKNNVTIDKSSKFAEEKLRIQNAIFKIDKDISNLIENLSKSTSNILISKVETKLSELESQREVLNKEIGKLSLEISMSKKSQDNIEYMISIANNFDAIFYNATPEEQKQILRVLIKHVIYNRGHITLEAYF